MTTLSNLMDVKYTETSSGNMLVSTPNGIILPTDPAQGTLSTTAQTLGPTDTYPSTISGIMINGVDVTSSISGGTLGANIQLRDSDIPHRPGRARQSFLDGGAAFQRAGPEPVRGRNRHRGRHRHHGGPSRRDRGLRGIDAGQPVDPVRHLARHQRNRRARVRRQLQRRQRRDLRVRRERERRHGATAGAQHGAGTRRQSPPPPIRARGRSSTWPRRCRAPGGQSASEASTEQTNSTATQTSVSTALGNVTNVSVDTEMSKMVALENSYSANAKVITAVQSMFSDILAAVDATS